MDFFDKKEIFLELFKEYLDNDSKENKNLILDFIKSHKNDDDFKDKDLFLSIFNEFEISIDNLSRKELKQRYSMLNTFIY
jgi:hypothetical protein